MSRDEIETGLPAQETGLLGRLVAAMIRRQTAKGFRHVLWTLPTEPLPRQVILVPNHHGWFDGYLMFLAAKAIGRPILDWIAAYDSFPLFGRVGGLPFPPDEPETRVETVRRTIRRMKAEERSLLLFAEGVLHEEPELLPFGRSLEVVAKAVPDAVVIPVAIVYAMGIHQLPEARIRFGAPLERGPDLGERCRAAVAKLLQEERLRPSTEVLLPGTRDINERIKPPYQRSRRKKPSKNGLSRAD